jgi:hypothetical protein
MKIVSLMSLMTGLWLLSGITAAQATPRQITNILDFAVPKPGEVTVGGCAFPAIKICTPQDSAIVNTDPARPLPLIQNDTKFDITGFTYKLKADNPIDAVWNPSSSSNLFKKVTISDNGKTIAYSDGNLKIGEYVKAIRQGGDKSIAYTVSFSGKPPKSVPESGLGWLGIAVMGGVLCYPRHKVA